MRFIRIALVLIELFVCIAAVLGGYGLITASGAASLLLLEGSPFNSFFVPALILTFIVGGTNLLGAIAVWTKNKYASEASAAAGMGLIIWIYAETYLLTGRSWLQTLFFSIGVMVLVLTMIEIKYKKPAVSAAKI